MVAVDRKDRNGYVNILIFVVDMIESAAPHSVQPLLLLPSQRPYGSKCSVGSLNSSSSQGLSP